MFKVSSIINHCNTSTSNTEHTVLWPLHQTVEHKSEIGNKPGWCWECSKRNAPLKCGFLHEMISSWGSALKTARNHFLKAVTLSETSEELKVLTVISTLTGVRCPQQWHTSAQEFIKRFIVNSSHTQQPREVSRVSPCPYCRLKKCQNVFLSHQTTPGVLFLI